MHKKNHLLIIIGWLLLLTTIGVLTKFILFKEPVASFSQLKKKIGGGQRRHGFEQKNLQLFATIDRIRNSHLSDDYKYKNIGGNILGFVPLGFLLPYLLFRKGKIIKAILLVFLISLFFELVQLHTGLGVFDVDDVLLNTVGGLCGALLFWAFSFRELRTETPG